MEKLAREKISAQQKLVALKKDLAATWEHVDFDAILPERNNTLDMNVPKTGMFIMNQIISFVKMFGDCLLFNSFWSRFRNERKFD